MSEPTLYVESTFSLTRLMTSPKWLERALESLFPSHVRAFLICLGQDENDSQASLGQLIPLTLKRDQLLSHESSTVTEGCILTQLDHANVDNLVVRTYCTAVTEWVFNHLECDELSVDVIGEIELDVRSISSLLFRQRVDRYFVPLLEVGVTMRPQHDMVSLTVSSQATLWRGSARATPLWDACIRRVEQIHAIIKEVGDLDDDVHTFISDMNHAEVFRVFSS